MKSWIITLFFLCLAFSCAKNDKSKIYMHNEKDMEIESSSDSTSSATIQPSDNSSDTENESINSEENKTNIEIIDESTAKSVDEPSKSSDIITKTTLSSKKSSVTTTIDPLEQDLLDLQEELKDQVDKKKSLNSTNINKANSEFDDL